MTTYYLRIEAVNLANFVYDTQDLSTIRGGSLLLRDAVARRIQQRFENLKEVSVGASAGLFRFDIEDAPSNGHGKKAIELRQEVSRWLTEDPSLCHATFVVDVSKAPRSFVLARERLIAQNRFRQMQQPSLIVPTMESSARIACELDSQRPGVIQDRVGEADVWYSQSTYVRRKFGRDQKRDFYEQEAGVDWGHYKEGDRPVVWDFEELTGDASKGNLHHKMALIYLDGNGFGQIQNEICTTEASQKEFDRVIREYRRGLLLSLINGIKHQPDWMTPADRYRIETLLWGGDEIIWVVPAWKGWDILSFFFEHTKEWNFNQRPLTHAAGLVFAGKSSPIYRVKALAEKLAGLAKEKSRDANFLAYQVLESFDYVDEDISRLLTTRFPMIQKPELATDWALSPGQMADLTTEVSVLRQDELFSKSKLHQLARGTSTQIEEIEKEFPSSGIVGGAIVSLKSKLGKLRWQHVAELWDYLPVKEGR